MGIEVSAEFGKPNMPAMLASPAHSFKAAEKEAQAWLRLHKSRCNQGVLMAGDRRQLIPRVTNEPSPEFIV